VGWLAWEKGLSNVQYWEGKKSRGWSPKTKKIKIGEQEVGEKNQSDEQEKGLGKESQ